MTFQRCKNTTFSLRADHRFFSCLNTKIIANKYIYILAGKKYAWRVFFFLYKSPWPVSQKVNVGLCLRLRFSGKRELWPVSLPEWAGAHQQQVCLTLTEKQLRRKKVAPTENPRKVRLTLFEWQIIYCKCWTKTPNQSLLGIWHTKIIKSKTTSQISGILFLNWFSTNTVTRDGSAPDKDSLYVLTYICTVLLTAQWLLTDQPCHTTLSVHTAVHCLTAVFILTAVWKHSFCPLAVSMSVCTSFCLHHLNRGFILN